MKAVTARQLWSIMICTACVAAQYSAILPILPMVVRAATGSTAQSGIVTGALGFGTIFSELQTPRLLAHRSAKAALAAGFVAMGCALAGLSQRPSLPIMVALGVLFGLGFGVNVTVGSTIVGSLGRTERRSHALAAYGAAAGLPMLVAPPLALLALPRIGVSGVFAGGTVVAALGLLASMAAPGQVSASGANIRLLATIKNPHVLFPFAAFFCVTFTYGGLVSLTPFLITGPGLASAPAFFLVFGIFRTIGRSGSASILRRLSATRLFLPSIVCAAAGLACLALTGLAYQLTAAVLFGLALGTAMTTSFVLMLDGALPAAASPVTALWNVGVDGGTGLGALALAPLAAAVGYRSSFAAMGAITLVGAGLGLAGARASHSEHRMAQEYRAPRP